MSQQNPYEQLGVAEDATFEEIQAAKQRVIAQLGGDSQLQDNVEAAYDAILMERLKLRQQGKIEHYDTMGQGHQIFHGRVDFYRKPAGTPPLVAD